MADQIAIIELPVRELSLRHGVPGPRVAGQVKLVDDARLELRLTSGRVFAIGMDDLQRAMTLAVEAHLASEQADGDGEA